MNKKKLGAILLAWILVMAQVPVLALAGSGKSPATGEEEAEVLWQTPVGAAYKTSTNPVYADGYIYIVSNNQMYQLDAEDGSILATTPLHTSSGYNYFLTGENDLLLMQEGLVVEAFDPATLESQWVSEPLSAGNQGLSPVRYHDGYVYGGTVNTAGGDAVMFCLSAADGSLVWEQKATLTAAGPDGYSGFYWAGATFVGDMVLFGSEGGRLYALDAQSGTILSTIDLTDYQDVNVRSTLLYVEGFVYAAASDGNLYRVSFDPNTGHFEEDVESFAIVSDASASNSSPQYADGLIYVGSSQGIGVFDSTSSGLTRVAEISLSLGKLQDLLLTETEDGVVGYTTYYSKPGSLVGFVYDGVNNPTFWDLGDVTQGLADNYCAACPALGPDGTLYFVNDANTVLAIGQNEAYVTGLTASTGSLSPAFAPYQEAYELILPAGTEEVILDWVEAEGASVWVNQEPAFETYTLNLAGEEKASLELSVQNGTDVRTYNIQIRTAATNTGLLALTTGSNSISDQTRLLSMENATTFVVTGVMQNVNDRLWLATADPNARLENWQVISGIEKSMTTVTSKNEYEGHTYTGRIYWSGLTETTRATVDVVAEDGQTKATYTFIITPDENYELTDAQVLVNLTLQDGNFAADKDGKPVQNYPVTVSDLDNDGSLTVDEAFQALHAAACPAGSSGYVSSDGWISRMWGIDTFDSSYLLNRNFANGTGDAIAEGDRLDVFFYRDVWDSEKGGYAFTEQGYSDLFIWFAQDTYQAVAGKQATFTVQGLNGAIPQGATVTILNGEGEEVASLATQVNAEGGFAIAFPQKGTYTVLVSGTCTYEGTAWDSASGGYVPCTYVGAPVVMTACTVRVSDNGGGSGGQEERDISVSITLLGDTVHSSGTKHTYAAGNLITWIPEITVSIPEGSTAGDLLKKVLDDRGYSYDGLDEGYLKSITKPDGTILAELDNGERSGWMFMINGNHPSSGFQNYILSEGDEVIWHYTDDWNREDVPGATGGGGFGDDEEELLVETPESWMEDLGWTTAASFSDVLETDWFADAVTYCVQRGIFFGVDGGSRFEPNTPLTRAQAAAILYRLDGSEEVSGSLTFADTDPEAWYGDALLWAVEEQVMTGYSAETFGPNDPLTREQMMCILLNYLDYREVETAEAVSLTEYPDADRVSDWAVEAVARAVGQGLLSGMNGLLAPQESVTRAQGAAFLQRMSQLLLEDPLSSAQERAAAAVYENTLAPIVGSIGGEWAVLGLLQAGYPVAEGYGEAYLKELERTLEENEGVLSERKYTEYSRVALTVTALGLDAQDVAGYDLIAPLKNVEKVSSQGINGPIWALIALDSGKYLPESELRNTYVQAILDAELAEGGWSLTNHIDADITGMALQALAPYQENEQVAAAIQRALEKLSEMQQESGDLNGNVEALSQVLMGLMRLGIPVTDNRFVKDGNTLVDALLDYQVSDGGFAHLTGETESNPMASEQALLALNAVLSEE